MNDFSDNIQGELISLIKEKWFSPLGLLTTLTLELLILAPYFWDNFGIGFNMWEYSILAIIVFSTFLVWGISRRYPKNVKNKIGIVVAITTENKEEYIKLKFDLIARFQETIKNRDLGNNFVVIELPEYYAKKVYDYSSSLKSLEKSRAHFIIYGTCKNRLENGKKCYFISSEATVIHHRSVPKIMSEQLSREFAELFPRRVIFPAENEISGFEITKEWMNLVVRYIIGIAAFLSGDFDLSFDLFGELRRELKLVDPNILQIKKLKTRIPQRISESAMALASRTYFIYRKTRPRNRLLLDKLKQFLDILNNIDPNNYPAHLLRGIYLFLVEKDIPAAKKEIMRSKNILDATWKYSKAFLCACDGDLDGAEKAYKKAFEAEINPDVIFQTEEFIYDVLETEPEKYQLWYCIGMLNWKAKGDSILAKEAFEKFLNYSVDDLFLEQKRKVAEYLKQL